MNRSVSILLENIRCRTFSKCIKRYQTQNDDTFQQSTTLRLRPRVVKTKTKKKKTKVETKLKISNVPSDLPRYKENYPISYGIAAFGLIKGHPMWPRKIEQKNNLNSGKVTFFGTNETGVVQIQNLYEYSENAHAFFSSRKFQRPNFQKKEKSLLEIKHFMKTTNL